MGCPLSVGDLGLAAPGVGVLLASARAEPNSREDSDARRSPRGRTGGWHELRHRSVRGLNGMGGREKQ
jgi:hypothetical protein